MTTPEFAARLVGLRGDLEKYNGRLVYPKNIGPDQFLLEVPTKRQERARGLTDMPQLTVPMRNLEALGEESLRHIKLAMSEPVKIDTSGNQGMKLRPKLDRLTSQVRSAIAKANSEYGSIEEVFNRFDKDGNGTIDKDEFIWGCEELKVKITPRDIAQLWPIFDEDNTGALDIAKFSAIVSAGSSRRQSFMRLREEMDETCINTTKKMRLKRIERKNNTLGELTEMALELQRCINQLIWDSGMSDAEWYKIAFDDKQVGDVNRTEFFEGLMRGKFKGNSDEMKMIWMMAVPNESAKFLSFIAFRQFLNSQTWVPLQLKDDMIMSLPNGEDDLIRILETYNGTRATNAHNVSRHRERRMLRKSGDVASPSSLLPVPSNQLVRNDLPAIAQPFVKPLKTDLKSLLQQKRTQIKALSLAKKEGPVIARKKERKGSTLPQGLLNSSASETIRKVSTTLIQQAEMAAMQASMESVTETKHIEIYKAPPRRVFKKEPWSTRTLPRKRRPKPIPPLRGHGACASASARAATSSNNNDTFLKTRPSSNSPLAARRVHKVPVLQPLKVPQPHRPRKALLKQQQRVHTHVVQATIKKDKAPEDVLHDYKPQRFSTFFHGVKCTPALDYY